MAITCLIFFSMFQLSRLFAAREILDHAAARGARARTVGFNWWMVEKSIRVASIPNAGRMVTPTFDTLDPILQAEMQGASSSGNLWDRLLRFWPISRQYDIERARIPEYLAGQYVTVVDHILDYEEWNTIHGDHGANVALPNGSVLPDTLVHVRVRQEVPLTVPMHRTFYAADTVDLEGESYLENHYPLYLDDRNW